MGPLPSCHTLVSGWCIVRAVASIQCTRCSLMELLTGKQEGSLRVPLLSRSSRGQGELIKSPPNQAMLCTPVRAVPCTAPEDSVDTNGKAPHVYTLQSPKTSQKPKHLSPTRHDPSPNQLRVVIPQKAQMAHLPPTPFDICTEKGQRHFILSQLSLFPPPLGNIHALDSDCHSESRGWPMGAFQGKEESGATWRVGGESMCRQAGSYNKPCTTLYRILQVILYFTCGASAAWSFQILGCFTH